jgi:hypothetical protein
MKIIVGQCCPECGARLSFVEGCVKCELCGWSACGGRVWIGKLKKG